ncbi:hypothetical protein [Ekhidna sp.]|uniref:hypothetical protein n=1 Tax=Ekhidna sp. TaxID=2608089 RepID=UPI003CCBB139
MKCLLFLLFILSFVNTSFCQSYSRGFQPHPKRTFHLELGTGIVTSDGRFGGGYSIEPQYTFANNVSIGFELSHRNFQLGNSNEPHKVNSFSPSIQIKGRSNKIAPFIGGRIGYFKVYDIDDTEPSSFGTMGASLNYGMYAWVVKLGMEASFYEPYGGSLFLYIKIRI